MEPIEVRKSFTRKCKTGDNNPKAETERKERAENTSLFLREHMSEYLREVFRTQEEIMKIESNPPQETEEQKDTRFGLDEEG